MTDEAARMGPIMSNHMMGKITPGGVHDGMTRFGAASSVSRLRGWGLLFWERIQDARLECTKVEKGRVDGDGDFDAVQSQQLVESSEDPVKRLSCVARATPYFNTASTSKPLLLTSVDK
jgi:hypothetical protein